MINFIKQNSQSTNLNLVYNLKSTTKTSTVELVGVVGVNVVGVVCV
jgi:hypothetical protein